MHDSSSSSPVPAFVLAPEGSLARSIQLFKAFRVEQTDPAFFYGLLAADTVREISRFAPVAGATILDVGGGPGYFAEAFGRAGARFAGLDADAGEMTAAGSTATTRSSGRDWTFLADSSVDICYSSNVLGIPDPQRMAEEMLRVTRPGGLVYLSWTTWFSPGRARDLPVALPRGPFCRGPLCQADGAPPQE